MNPKEFHNYIDQKNFLCFEDKKIKTKENIILIS